MCKRTVSFFAVLMPSLNPSATPDSYSAFLSFRSSSSLSYSNILIEITSDLFARRNSERMSLRIHSSTASLTASFKSNSFAYLRTQFTYCAYSLKVLHCSISSLLSPSLMFIVSTSSSSFGSPDRFSKDSDKRFNQWSFFFFSSIIKYNKLWCRDFQQCGRVK